MNSSLMPVRRRRTTPSWPVAAAADNSAEVRS